MENEGTCPDSDKYVHGGVPAPFNPPHPISCFFLHHTKLPVIIDQVLICRLSTGLYMSLNALLDVYKL